MRIKSSRSSLRSHSLTSPCKIGNMYFKLGLLFTVIISFATHGYAFGGKVYLVEEEGTIERGIDRKAITIENCPYQVLLKNARGHLCGAAIITDRHILTSARCLDSVFGKGANSLDTRDFNVTTGTANSQTEGQNHRILQFTYHPEYNTEISSDNDIAVITLAEPISFNHTQKPVILPSNNVESGSSATFCGWNKGLESSLHALRMRVLPKHSCQIAWNHSEKSTYNYKMFGEQQICAEDQFKSGVCIVDRGGPLVVGNVLIGIVSFRDNSCKKFAPVIFTDVILYVPWIYEIIARDKAN